MAAGVSSLIVEEYLASGDARFLESLRQLTDPKKTASIAEKWKRDHRPWAREQIFAYLDLPANVPGHEPIIKRLFKHAEENRDDELLGAFMVYFDRLIRRKRRKERHYDWQSRQYWEEETLITPRDRVRAAGSRTVTLPFGPREGEEIAVPIRGREGRLFTYKTRHYLQRRAWRYFRRLGFQKPEKFVPAVADALRRYVDDDLKLGENLLDSWSLMHACFFESDVITFNAYYAKLKESRSLGDLQAAPAFSELWTKPEAAKVLLNLVTRAASHTVRVWAMQLLKREHLEHLEDVAVETLLTMFDHADADVQTFAVELLEKAKGLEKLPLETWLRLLRTRNLTALETITQIMLRHVSAERLNLQQMVELASAEPIAVARVGFRFLQTRKIESPADRETIAQLGNARSDRIGGEIATWALAIVGAKDVYDVENVVRFFDSLQPSIRAAAWAWLTETSPGYNDPALWSRLLETPYDDVRLKLVENLKRRAALPGTGAEKLTPLWASVLLNVHRGGRAKLVALNQISGALRADPNRAEVLLPVISVAIRSVRWAEARAGLAAVVAAVEARPDIMPVVNKHLPELEIPAENLEVAT